MQVVEFGTTFDIQLDPNQGFSGATFSLAKDLRYGGTDITVSGTVPAWPVLSGGGNTVDYTIGGKAATVDAGLGVSDASSATLAGATVTISTGFLAGDTLNFTKQNGITGSYIGTTGVLTLTGSASLAAYQAALDSITYDSTASDPTNSGADLSRTIAWTVTDGKPAVQYHRQYGYARKEPSHACHHERFPREQPDRAHGLRHDRRSRRWPDHLDLRRRNPARNRNRQRLRRLDGQRRRLCARRAHIDREGHELCGRRRLQ